MAALRLNGHTVTRGQWLVLRDMGYDACRGAPMPRDAVKVFLQVLKENESTDLDHSSAPVELESLSDGII